MSSIHVEDEDEMFPVVEDQIPEGTRVRLCSIDGSRKGKGRKDEPVGASKAESFRGAAVARHSVIR